MITEDPLEQLAIQWFQNTGWNYVHGAVIAPEAEPSSQPSPTGRRRNTSEREDFRAVVLKGRLAEAVRRLNPKLPKSAVEEVVRVVTTPNITLLSDEFLEDMRRMEKNLAVELLERLQGKIKAQTRTNGVGTLLSPSSSLRVLKKRQ